MIKIYPRIDMKISKDDLFMILQRYDDRYRDNLKNTIRFIDEIFDTFHREQLHNFMTKVPDNKDFNMDAKGEK